MNRKKYVTIALGVFLLASLAVGMVQADDGQLFRRNISKTPGGETEEAAISMMKFYVPAQTSVGELVSIEYFDSAGTLIDTRDHAKPLVSIYIDGIEEEHEMLGFLSTGATSSGVGFGHRDAFGALSLDDGATWKRHNLSDSAHLSSFTLANGLEYPGDVHHMTFAVAGEKVLAGWLSKYCMGGSPNYTLSDEDKIALQDEFGLPDLYLQDDFGVAGSQGSVDYTLQGFPEVGEVPYSCVWTARGKLVQDPETGLYELAWTKAERLTSGRRDANRLEIAAASGAGFVMVWQEDPEGLRPGQGLGPGEGWSGAIVNQKTDIWYSYIDWDEFEKVRADDGTAVEIEEYTGEEIPKVALPMAIPIRISDNNMCKAGLSTDNTQYQPYCVADFDGNGTADLCATSVSWTNPGGTTMEICQAEDGRVLWGRTGGARPRINLQGYDSDNDGSNDSAWVIMAYEETKALGEGDNDTLEEPLDVGKNIWYHSFDMFNPDIVAQGGMINHPAKDPETGDYFPPLVDEFGNEFYETEISRRFNLMTQSVGQAGDSGTVGILFYKMGIINQGGPADIFLRRLVLPDNYDPTEDNPYEYHNIACETWEYKDGANPRYVEGLCKDTGINVSATNIVACDNGASGESCADLFPWDGGVSPFPKVTEWSQTEDNLDDESWENPYDVSKGHRGFIDGDFLMVMYAWSPNWKANSVGNDKYNLYIRRSFDGGITWTTTPAELGGDGTCTTENYLSENGSVETCYGAGEFEPARNVSQLTGTKVTILDPRYTPTPASIFTDEAFLYPDDERDPSKFFIVYETGDNTTVAEGEATPLDLFYSRGYNWGDDYDYVEYYKDGEVIEGWDWLEHDREDLSGEASVTSNPAGNFFYSVWNQWQEPEEEVIENSDIIFRRVMYIDEADSAPSSDILYTSHTAAGYNDTLTFVGTARDNDHLGEGIVAYQWRSDRDGVLGFEKTLTIPASALSPGLHTLLFCAQDGEGNWTPEVSTTIFIAEELSQVHLPALLR